MSAPLHNIILHNNTGERRRYAFVCAPPATNNFNSNNLYTTAWTTTDLQQNGTHCMSTTDHVFAWAGHCTQRLQPGVVVQNGSMTPVQLGNHSMRGTTAHMTVERGIPEFGACMLGAPQGAFQIDCDNSFRSDEEYVIGMAKVDHRGLVAPVCVMPAQPNMNCTMMPRMRFYIGQSQCMPGEICDMNDCAVVDFTNGNGRDRHTAVVSQDERGHYNVQYYDHHETRDVMQAVRDGQLRSHLHQRRSGSNDDKLRELSALTSTLTRLLQSMDFGAGDSDVMMRWVGRVNWPSAISHSTCKQGASLICNSLSARGYNVTQRVNENSDGTKTAEFNVSRNAHTLMGADPDADWHASLKADTQSDGHTNGGLMPAPGLDRAALTKAQKRQSMMQLKDMLSNGFMGQQMNNDYLSNIMNNMNNGMNNNDMHNHGMNNNNNNNKNNSNMMNGINMQTGMNGMRNGMNNGMSNGMMNGMNNDMMNGMSNGFGMSSIHERSNGVF